MGDVLRFGRSDKDRYASQVTWDTAILHHNVPGDHVADDPHCWCMPIVVYIRDDGKEVVHGSEAWH